MPYRKEQFANGEIYHIILRILSDDLLFQDERDFFRMIFSIYEFNNSNPVDIFERRKERARFKKSAEGRTFLIEEDKRDKLVDVLCFCWMPNHIHLLLRQVQDGGITKFMRKVGTGYATYFNKKYQRKGYLFQSRFKSVHIENDRQLQAVFAYIHTNPIASIESGWKEKGILDPARAKKFLEEEYRWSSYWDYLGKNNFPSITEREFILEVMSGIEGVRRAVNDWIDYKGEIKNIPNFE